MRYVKPITFWDLSHLEMMASVKKLKSKLMQSNSNILVQMEKCRIKNIFKAYLMHLQILVFILEQAKWQSKYLLRQGHLQIWMEHMLVKHPNICLDWLNDKDFTLLRNELLCQLFGGLRWQ